MSDQEKAFNFSLTNSDTGEPMTATDMPGAFTVGDYLNPLAEYIADNYHPLVQDEIENAMLQLFALVVRAEMQFGLRMHPDTVADVLVAVDDESGVVTDAAVQTYKPMSRSDDTAEQVMEGKSDGPSEG